MDEPLIFVIELDKRPPVHQSPTDQPTQRTTSTHQNSSPQVHYNQDSLDYPIFNDQRYGPQQHDRQSQERRQITPQQEYYEYVMNSI